MTLPWLGETTIRVVKSRKSVSADTLVKLLLAHGVSADHLINLPRSKPSKISKNLTEWNKIGASLNDIRESLFNDKAPTEGNEALSFDSIETFKRFMSQNKLQILMAISRLKPESIYQLEKLLSRKYPHVLKDCRQLEALGFIKLVEAQGAKKQLQPELIFDYDLIKVNSELEELFPISKRSNQVLLEANAG